MYIKTFPTCFYYPVKIDSQATVVVFKYRT